MHPAKKAKQDSENNLETLETMLTHAKNCFKAAKYGDAISGFLKVIEKDPNNFQHHLSLGLSYFHLSETLLPPTVLENPHLKKAVKSFTTALTLNPSCKEAELQRARCYQLLGQNDQVTQDQAKELAELAKSLKKTQTSTNTNKNYPTKASLDFETRYQQAIDFYYKGNIPTALGMFEQLLKDNPQDASLFNILSVLYYQMGSVEKALDSFKKAREKQAIGKGFAQNDPTTYYIRGYLYYLSDDFVEAKNSFINAINSNQNNRLAYLGIGFTYYMLHQYQNALKYFLAIQQVIRTIYDQNSLLISIETNYGIGKTLEALGYDGQQFLTWAETQNNQLSLPLNKTPFSYIYKINSSVQKTNALFSAIEDVNSNQPTPNSDEQILSSIGSVTELTLTPAVSPHGQNIPLDQRNSQNVSSAALIAQHNNFIYNPTPQSEQTTNPNANFSTVPMPKQYYLSK